MDIQFIKTESGEELVVLTRADYDALLEAAEDGEDLAAANAGFQGLADGTIPADVSRAIRAGVNPIAAWRGFRGIKQADLAAAAQVTQPAIARLEKAKIGAGENGTLRRIAAALNAPVWSLKGHDPDAPPQARGQAGY